MSDSNLPAPVPAKQPGALATTEAPMTEAQRWQLIRAMIRFQIKLVVDGLKDIVLGPLSLVAGSFDLLRGSSMADSWFRSVLRSGARFDAWVNLFEEPPREPEQLQAPQQAANLDVHLRYLEQLIVDEHARGGITANAKQAIDSALDVLEARTAKLGDESSTSRTR